MGAPRVLPTAQPAGYTRSPAVALMPRAREHLCSPAWSAATGAVSPMREITLTLAPRDR
jgi:hypothetical protein